jgi:Zn-dependent protease with chaperone function
MHTDSSLCEEIAAMMRLRTIAVLLLLIFAMGGGATGLAATPTEAKALAQAAQDKTAYVLPPEKLAKAVAYDHQRLWLTGADFVWGVAQLVLLLALGGIRRMRNVAVNLTKRRWGQGFVFLLLFSLVTTLLSLPLDVLRQHLELAYGMSVQGWASWAGDEGKSFALGMLFGWPMLMLFFWVIRKSPRRWWFWFWIPAMAAVLFGVFISPVLIDPLFNKFEPLQASNPALVAQLEKVVQRGGINIPPERMFLMKASDKVTTLNAYVTGFGASKRVVVWDTSIAKGTPDEISFIFGHEMGHYVLNHIPSTLAFVGGLLLVGFYLGYVIVGWLVSRYGGAWGVPSQNDWGFLAVFMLVLTVLSFFGEPIVNAYSRGHEHAADVYGQEAIHGIVADPQKTAQEAFQLLGENGLSNPYPSELEVFWLYSHPPIGLRAGFGKAYDPWAVGEEPKYFKK